MSFGSYRQDPLGSVAAPATPTLPIYTTQEREQPQWSADIPRGELEQFRTLRDISINGRIAQIVEQRRSNGYVPPGEALINPLGVEARVTSLPSTSRWHPFLREEAVHTGLDFVPVRAPSDGAPPVYAASSGTVVYVGRFSERAGEFVMMLDDDNRIVVYAHLIDGSTRSIRVGDHIPQGQQIALMGNTGPRNRNGDYALAPHLHFGVRVLGEGGREQSAQAQAQRVALASTFVQPMGERIEDPALNYAMYDVIHPPFEGETYRSRGARIPAPSAQYTLAARDVRAAPTPTVVAEQTPPVSTELPALPGVSGGETLQPVAPPSWEELVRQLGGPTPPR